MPWGIGKKVDKNTLLCYIVCLEMMKETISRMDKNKSFGSIGTAALVWGQRAFALLRALRRYLWLAVAVAVLCGLIALAVTALQAPRYEASVQFYVRNTETDGSGQTTSFTAAELSATSRLIGTYLVILDFPTTLEAVIDEAQLSCSAEELRGMIHAEAVGTTQIFRVTVTDGDPAEAARIANAIGAVLPEKIAEVAEGSDVRVAESASVPAKRVAPGYGRHGLLAGFSGAVAAILGIAAWALLGDRVLSAEELSEAYNGLRVLTEKNGLYPAPKLAASDACRVIGVTAAGRETDTMYAARRLAESLTAAGSRARAVQADGFDPSPELLADWDAILLALSPVTETPEALLASRLCEGIFVAVRRKKTKRSILADTVLQLRLAERPIRGFLLTDQEEEKQCVES